MPKKNDRRKFGGTLWQKCNLIYTWHLKLEQLNVWIFEQLKIWTFEHLNIWIFEHLSIRTFEHLKIWTFEYLKYWTFEDWNIRTFEHLNISTNVLISNVKYQQGYTFVGAYLRSSSGLFFVGPVYETRLLVSWSDL